MSSIDLAWSGKLELPVEVVGDGVFDNEVLENVDLGFIAFSSSDEIRITSSGSLGSSIWNSFIHRVSCFCKLRRSRPVREKIHRHLIEIILFYHLFSQSRWTTIARRVVICLSSRCGDRTQVRMTFARCMPMRLTATPLCCLIFVLSSSMAESDSFKGRM